MNETQRQRLERVADSHDAIFADFFLPDQQSKIDHERRRIVGRALRLMLGTANLSRLVAAQWAYDQAAEYARQYNQRQFAIYAQIKGFKHPISDDKTLDVQSFAQRTQTSVLVLTHFLRDEE